MLKTYFDLFIQFFNVGLFSFGGGYATIPFLYDISNNFNWYSSSELTQMIALSSITPGPIGVNMATYAGFVTKSVLGAIIATTSIILPSYIIVTIVSKMLKKFKTNQNVIGAIKGLKACGCALLSAVFVKLIFTSSLYLLGSLIVIALISTSFIKKQDPLFYLVVTAVLGCILGCFYLIGV